jgi:SAM-dependent methyltransferase
MAINLEDTFKQAEKLQKSNNLKEALNLYEKIIEFKPNHKPTLLNLGNLFHQNANLNKAKYYYEKLLLLESQNSQLIYNLAIIFFRLNDLKNSLYYFDKLIKIDPNLKYLSYNLRNVMRSKNILDLKKNDKKLVKDLFLFLFKAKDIDHSVISKNALFFIYNKNEINDLNDEENLLSKKLIKNLIREEIFHLFLQKTILIENNLEKTLTIIRREILLKKNNDNFLKDEKNKNFLISLAEQCWLNEYIWFETKNELLEIRILKERIEKDPKINELEIAILACYLPLNSLNKINTKLINYVSENKYFNELIEVQIKEPFEEIELKKNIKSISEFKNKISKEVRQQYEKNPYPRWRYCNQLYAINLENDLNHQIRPNNINFEKKSEKINILIAGCGTGKHLINIGKYDNSNILAVDLSLASIAYAKRKVKEFNYNNIKFLHADILDLKDLEQKFDVIESVGTLHHMENPTEGLKSLLKVLKPNGFLKLGLYSELARKEIVSLIETIKNRNYKPNINGIRAIREFILSQNKSSNLYNSIFTQDFYSTSRIRDLLFHVQEHRFTIPTLIKIFKDFNLEFLGFSFQNYFTKYQYSKLFPNDKKMINLENWNEFEIKYPSTFLGMYQFYVRKINME